MNDTSKRETALRILEATGMRRSSYAPLMTRLLWHIGVDVPPPHFASFWQNFFGNGAFFACAWVVYEWLIKGHPLPVALLLAIIPGVFFGIGMSAYYMYSARKRKLPLWREL